MKHKTIRDIYHFICCVTFLVLICVPVSKMLLSETVEFSFVEKRVLAVFPSTPAQLSELDEYFNGVTEYINDHFGFRDLLIKKYHSELKRIFGIKGDSVPVHAGLDNWYFFTRAKMLEDFTGRFKVKDDDYGAWLYEQQEKVNWLKEKNIDYVFMVAPNKQAVFPENVSANSTMIRGKSVLNQLQSKKIDPALNIIIDLEDVLLKQKRDILLYFKTDTHWTNYGAYQAYLAIMAKLKEIFPDFSYRTEATFKTINRTCDINRDKCGDLTTMLPFFDSFPESFEVYDLKEQCAVSVPVNVKISDVPEVKDTEAVVRKKCGSGQLKAVVFHDSFGLALEPMFSESFSEVLYIWKRFNKKNVEEVLQVFKPDVVIEEMVERNFVSRFR